MVAWHAGNNLLIGQPFNTAWTYMPEKLESKYLTTDHMDMSRPLLSFKELYWWMTSREVQQAYQIMQALLDRTPDF